MSGDLEGYADAYGLGLVDGEEIHVEALVSHGMPLKLMEHGGLSLASVDHEVDDV